MAADSNIPTHVAIIMDGNGRWAKERGLPRQAGHRAGVKSARRVVEYMAEQGVEYTPGRAFHCRGENIKYLRLSYPHMPADEIDAVRQQIDRHGEEAILPPG